MALPQDEDAPRGRAGRLLQERPATGPRLEQYDLKVVADEGENEAAE